MNAAHLLAIMPECPPAHLNEYTDALNDAMAEGLINTGLRQAAFLAQCAYESDQLRKFLEVSDGEFYEGSQLLGNNQPGDGPKFIGRGAIQITGRFNYTQAGLDLGLPLLDMPELLEHSPAAFRGSVWFWNARALSPLADSPDAQFLQTTHNHWNEITRRINGEYTWFAPSWQKVRTDFYNRAKAALGV